MILDEILGSKRRELEQRRRERDVQALRGRTIWHQPRRGFVDAIASAAGRCIIAEIKRRSPSCGVIRERFDPAAHAAAYAKAGATCVSVLTDGPHFGGGLEDLEAARGACTLPLLRKDFIVDRYQVVEARAYGADAILLIVGALSSAALDELLGAARSEELDVLTEVHDERELQTALEAGAELIGINNRDLRTFETSVAVSRRLAPLIPDGVLTISESGLSQATELEELERAGIDGFLIGETFMAAADPGAALDALLRA